MKEAKTGTARYEYYRCSKYKSKDHPNIRLRETKIDEQILNLFDRLEVKDKKIQTWFQDILRAKCVDAQKATKERRTTLQTRL